MSRKYNRLFVGNIKRLKDHDQLKKQFASIGKLQNWSYYQYDDYVYLQYQNSTGSTILLDADQAIKKFNGIKYLDKFMLVQYSSKSANRTIQKKKQIKEEEMRKGLCFICKQKGHVWKDCHQNQQQINIVKESQSSEDVDIIESQSQQEQQQSSESEKQKKSKSKKKKKKEKEGKKKSKKHRKSRSR